MVIRNIVIAGPATSGKSRILCELLKTISPAHKTIIVTDYKEEAQLYDNTNHTCLYPKVFSFDGKVKLLKEALERRPHILAVDEIRESKEALLIHDILTKGDSKVWFTVGSGFSLSDVLYRFNALLGFAYSQDTLNELLMKFDIVVLKSRKTGQRPYGEVFSQRDISLKTLQGMVSKPMIKPE